MINTFSSKSLVLSKLLLNKSLCQTYKLIKSLFNKQINFFSQNKRSSYTQLQNKAISNKNEVYLNKSKDRTQKGMFIKNQEDDQQNRLAIRKNKQKQSRQISQFFYMDEGAKLKTIQIWKRKQKIRQLSMISKQMLFERQQSQVIWCALQQAFVSLIEPTQDQNKIRGLSKFLYSLGKSKRATRNYQTPMALLLPFSSHQSFTQIVTTISRMGGMSQQFGHIVEKLYWKRRQEFNPLEVNLINYVLAKNGKKIDAQIIEKIDNFPLRSIVLMLRAYDNANMMSQQILNKCISPIIARKRETNFLDFRGIVNIYSKYLCLDNKKLLDYLEQQYRYLARNVNQQAIQEIWEYFPKAVNANKLPVTFVQQIIKSLKILRTRNKISERTWKKIALSFGDFENLEIRTQLEKI